MFFKKKKSRQFNQKSVITNLDEIAKPVNYGRKPGVIICICICIAVLVLAFAYFYIIRGGHNPFKAGERIRISEINTEKKTAAEKESAAEDETSEGNFRYSIDDETFEEKGNQAGGSESLGENSRQDGGGESSKEAFVLSVDEAEIPQIPILPDNPTSDDVAEALYRTVDIGSYEGSLALVYAQPDIPKEYHASIKLEVFNEAGATIYRYISDAGWLSEPENYNAEERLVIQKLDVDSLENRLMVLTVKVGDEKLEEYATVYQLIQEYDGSRSFTKAVI